MSEQYTPLAKEDPTGSLNSAPTPQDNTSMLSRSLWMSASFTFSINIALIGLFAQLMKGDKKLNLASASLITTLMNLCVIIMVSAVFAVARYSSESYGVEQSDDEQKKIAARKKTAAAFKTGIYWSVFAATAVAGTLFFSKSLLVACNQDEDVAQRTQDFTRPVAPLAAFSAWRVLSEQIMFGYKNTKRTAILSLTSFFLLGLPVALGLSFGTTMGLTGLAYGFLADSIGVSALFTYHLKTNPAYADIPFLKTTPTKTELKEFAKSGFSFTLPFASEQLAFFVLNLIVGQLGKNELAAQNFPLQLIFIANLFQWSIAHTSAQDMCEHLGTAQSAHAKSDRDHNTKLAHLAARSGLVTNLKCNFAISAALAVALYFMAKPHDFFHYMKYLLPIAVGTQLCETAHYTITTHTRYRDKVLKPTIMSSGSRWVGVLLAYLVTRYTDTGIYGVNLAYMGSLLLGLIPLTKYWLSHTTENALSQNMAIPASPVARA